jgi:hypothetical protein
MRKKESISLEMSLKGIPPLHCGMTKGGFCKRKFLWYLLSSSYYPNIPLWFLYSSDNYRKILFSLDFLENQTIIIAFQEYIAFLEKHSIKFAILTIFWYTQRNN